MNCLAAVFHDIAKPIQWADSEQFLKLTIISLQAILLDEDTFIDKVLYKNSGFKQIWKCLDVFSQHPRRHVVIQGPPGAGKSSACWAWSCAYSRLGKTVAYAFLKGQRVMCGAVLREGSIVRLSKSVCSIEECLEFFQGQHPEALIVVDGVRQSNMDFCLTMHGPWILVTSSGFRIISQDEETLFHETTHVDSWTFEEYQKAISTKELPCSDISTAMLQSPGPVIIDNNILKHDAVTLCLDQGSSDFKDLWLEEKYYFCGGSVRYMFAFDLTRSKQSIDKAFSHEPDIEKLLGNEDSLVAAAVGNIRQRVNERYILLSKYVMRKLFEHKLATDSIIAMIKNRATEIGNNAFKGWAHEMQMLAYLQQCVKKGPGAKTFKMMLQDNDGVIKEELTFNLESEHFFFKESAIVQTLRAEKVLLLPEKFNQGCYDAVVALLKNHQEGKDILLVLRATVGKGHSFKQSFLTTLILQLAKNTSEVSEDDEEDQDWGQEAKKLKTETGSNGQKQQGIMKSVSALVGRLVIWHCFVLETEVQLKKFRIPLADNVGIRSSQAEREWQIKPILFKTLLTAPQ